MRERTLLSTRWATMQATLGLLGACLMLFSRYRDFRMRIELKRPSRDPNDFGPAKVNAEDGNQVMRVNTAAMALGALLLALSFLVGFVRALWLSWH